MNLSLASHDRDVYAVICEGEITHEHLLDPSNPLTQFIGERGFAETILIDLSGVTLIDSAGIGWLIRTHQRCQKESGLLLLHSVSDSVNHVFELMQLPGQLHMAADQAEAMAWLKNNR